MKNKIPKTPEYTNFHLRECIIELESIIQRLGNPKFTSDKFAVAMSHAYHHLNFAWNIRQYSSKRIFNIDADSSDTEFYKMRKMPIDVDLDDPLK
jgi:hypothetical protein